MKNPDQESTGTIQVILKKPTKSAAVFVRASAGMVSVAKGYMMFLKHIKRNKSEANLCYLIL